jgi:hypothetical protein
LSAVTLGQSLLNGMVTLSFAANSFNGQHVLAIDASEGFQARIDRHSTVILVLHLRNVIEGVYYYLHVRFLRHIIILKTDCARATSTFTAALLCSL